MSPFRGQEGLTKTVQFFGNNLVQCMKKYSKWSKFFVPFLVINASSDMVWKFNGVLIEFVSSSHWVQVELVLSSCWVQVEFALSSHRVRVEFSLRCICVKTQDHVILQHAEYQTQSSRYSFPPFYKFKAVFFLAFDFLQYYNTSVKKFYQSCNSVKLTSSFLSWQVRDWHTKNHTKL